MAYKNPNSVEKCHRTQPNQIKSNQISDRTCGHLRQVYVQQDVRVEDSIFVYITPDLCKQRCILPTLFYVLKAGCIVQEHSIQQWHAAHHVRKTWIIFKWDQKRHMHTFLILIINDMKQISYRTSTGCLNAIEWIEKMRMVICHWPILLRTLYNANPIIQQNPCHIHVNLLGPSGLVFIWIGGYLMLVLL